jgi:hypothetical protein
MELKMTKVVKREKKMHYRKIYSYICSGCSNKRKTYKYEVFLNEVCCKCRRHQIPKNQISLFNEAKNPISDGFNTDTINGEDPNN